jgi:antitoxin YefM
MNAIPLENARSDFDGVVARVLADAEPVMVNTAGGGKVVIMPLDEFESWQETAYLLKDPANAAHLRESLAQVDRGQVAEHELDER